MTAFLVYFEPSPIAAPSAVSNQIPVGSLLMVTTHAAFLLLKAFAVIVTVPVP